MPELSFSEVGEILHLLQAVEASSVELEWGDLTIQVRRDDAAHSAPPVAESPPGATASVLVDGAMTGASGTTAASARPPVEASLPDSVDEIPSHWIAVNAPMAGTFYRAPAADRPPYVEVGDTVSPGDTVALIEVMKLFTELKSDISGEVVKIDGAESTLVEFGQPLIWIAPA